jgi:hypothetical protein
MLPRPTKPTVNCCSGTLISTADAFVTAFASIVIAGRPADQPALIDN